MRIVTWNCCRGEYERKIAYLRDVSPDIAVVQECARPPAGTPGVHWFGDIPRQGVAVFAGNGYRVDPLPSPRELPKWVLPLRVTGRACFTLVAVWTLPIAGSYSRALIEGVDALREMFAGGPTVVAGDFNASPVFDRPRARYGYLRAAALLAEAGVESAYHAFHAEAPGAERSATYYHQWKREQPFHIDYCFVPRGWLPRVRDVAVGSYDGWRGRSDHRPLLVDIADHEEHAGPARRT